MNVAGSIGSVSDLHTPFIWNIDIFTTAASRLQVFLRPPDPWPSHCFCCSCLSLCSSRTFSFLYSHFLPSSPTPLTCHSSVITCFSLPTHYPSPPPDLLFFFSFPAAFLSSSNPNGLPTPTLSLLLTSCFSPQFPQDFS